MARRSILVLCIAALAAALTPAQAAGNVTCVLSGKANFTPGATLTAQPLTYTFSGNLAACTGSDSTAKSGTVVAVGAGTFSCANGPSAGTASIYWNNGGSSGVSFTANNTAAVVRLGGSFTSGLFAGAKITGAILFEANPVACVNGLPSANFHGAVRAA